MDSNLDTVIVHLYIDDNPFYEEAYLSRTGSLLSQGCFFLCRRESYIYLFIILGWSTKKLIFAGLLALCIIGIILAIVFLVVGKKFKKNKRSTPAGAPPGPKSVVTKTGSPDPKYQPVPNV
jgi:hypothetical protein